MLPLEDDTFTKKPSILEEIAYRRKLTVEVVDIFGDDTMTIVEVTVGGTSRPSNENLPEAVDARHPAAVVGVASGFLLAAAHRGCRAHSRVSRQAPAAREMLLESRGSMTRADHWLAKFAELRLDRSGT